MANTSPVWGLNEKGEIVAAAGTGTSNIVGFLHEDTLPTDAAGRVLIAGLGSGGGGGGAGSPGADGKTVLNGTTAPSNAVGTNGDFYLNTVNFTMYGPKAAGAWPAGVSLIGTNGTNGSNGTNGKTILNGTAAPSSGVGTDGDFYINTTATTIYGPKASGAWPAGVSLIGTGGGSGVTFVTDTNGQGVGIVGPDGKVMGQGIATADVTANFNVAYVQANLVVPVNSASAVVATIQQDSTTLLPIGFTIALFRKGTGGASFAAGTGVTIQSPNGSVAARSQYSTITAVKIAANTWVVAGDLI